MKILLLLSVILITGVDGSNQQVRFCSLRGQVYVAKERAQADFIVYEEESEAFADFLVFEEENRLYATEAGLWFFVETRGIADFSIYYTKEKSEADFIIAFTDSPTFAGCD